MALTHLAFCNLGSVVNAASLPITLSGSVVSEAITPTASNQQSSASTRGFVRVATDTAVYVAFGANPDATTTTGRFYLPAGSVEWYAISVSDKVAVVTA